MTEQHKPPRPAILFSHFDGSVEFVAMAHKLMGLGYPVIAACLKSNSAAIAAAGELGCSVAEAEGDGGLRAGLALFRDNRMEELPGVVVFEPEDGFSADDAQRVAEAFEGSAGKLVLASRCRNKNLSLFSNLVRWLAALAFTLVHGRKVGDPWASLRAIPSRYVPGFLDLKGDGCRLHLNMILNLQHMGIKTVNVPVSTAYEYEAGSRFLDRAIDIFRILLLPLKFVSASVAAMLSDNAMFLLVGYLLTQNQLRLTTVIARATGAIVGYLLNRNVVFRDRKNADGHDYKPLLKYVILASCNTLIAMFLVPYINSRFGIYAFVSKQIVDVILFISNFLIQRDIIFKRKPVND